MEMDRAHFKETAGAIEKDALDWNPRVLEGEDDQGKLGEGQ
jgi:hypothetical protein